MIWVPRAQVVQAVLVLAPALALVPVPALHPAVPVLVPAQVQAPPLQAVPALVPAHLQVARAQAPAQVLVPAPAQALIPVQAPVLHPRVNLTVITKNMTHTDQ